MKDKYIAALLCFLVGFLGIHEFYLGKNGRGVAHLVFGIFTFWMLFTPLFFIPLIQCIILFIEWIMFLTMSTEQFNAEYNISQTKPLQTPTPTPAPTATLSSPSANVSQSTKSESLLALKELLDKGILSQEEFDAEKKKILNL